jgi:hypothetical protein
VTKCGDLEDITNCVLAKTNPSKFPNLGVNICEWMKKLDSEDFVCMNNSDVNVCGYMKESSNCVDAVISGFSALTGQCVWANNDDTCEVDDRKCINKSVITGCCQFKDSTMCNMGSFYDNTVPRGCFWNENTCESFGCSNYVEAECFTNGKNVSGGCFYNKGSCDAPSTIKVCSDLKDGTYCRNPPSGNNLGSGKSCDWVSMSCVVDPSYQCIDDGSADYCCEYTRSEDCLSVGSGSSKKGCVWRQDDVGKCVDFTCDDYAAYGDNACNNNLQNVAGGCFVNGVNVCVSYSSITSCNEIKKHDECMSTKDTANSKFKGLGVKKCEWVKKDSLDQCVENTEVTDCAMYSATDCDLGSLYKTDPIPTFVGSQHIFLSFFIILLYMIIIVHIIYFLLFSHFHFFLRLFQREWCLLCKGKRLLFFWSDIVLHK